MEQLEQNKSKKPDQSGVEGSASNAIIKWWSNYDFYNRTPQEIYLELTRIIPKDELSQASVCKLLNQIINSKNAENAALLIGNFVLRGDHQSILANSKRFPK